MTVCLDASVVLKLLVYETDSERAVQWLNSHEGASVLQRRVRIGEVTAQERTDALDVLESMQIRSIWDYALIRQATALADEMGQPTVYDTIYLAVAERERCIFLTADQRFARAASGTYSSVRLL